MKTNAKKIIASALIPAFLTACATAGKDVTATYVSPVQFSSYDCEQIRQETLRIQGRANQLSGRLDEAASNDKTIAGVGMILFWPALFALGGTKQQEAELSRLKGEYDALSAASVSKKCS
jgi:ABC-type phosphate transport system auxiliary subunit